MIRPPEGASAWRYVQQKKRSRTRLIPLDSDNGEEEICPGLDGPNLQLSIRPKQRDTMTVGELVGRVTPLKLELPLFGEDALPRAARNEYGVCRYTISTPAPREPGLIGRMLGRLFPGSERGKPEAQFKSFTQLYADGEMWLVDLTALQLAGRQEDERCIPPGVESRFVAILDRARASLRHLGMAEPYEVVATILGIGDCVLPLMNSRGELTGKRTPKTDAITITRELSVEAKGDSSLSCLMELFEALWESMHSVRPDFYNALATQPGPPPAEMPDTS